MNNPGDWQAYLAKSWESALATQHSLCSDPDADVETCRGGCKVWARRVIRAAWEHERQRWRNQECYHRTRERAADKLAEAMEELREAYDLADD